MRFLFILVHILLLISCESKKQDITVEYPTRFELTKGKETATYKEVIKFYIQLAKEFPEINIQTIGETDSGNPLHIVTYNSEGDFNYQKIEKNKIIILINNGIHPGESDGIDATMIIYRDLVTGKIKAPKNTVLVTIPIFNIGGALNRNSNTRVNQNSLIEYSFRGNALNYDLNRDFIKSDTKNVKTFAKIFHLVNPDIFIDNQVSNGADYQYTLSHLFTQHNKLGGELGHYLNTQMQPTLENLLSNAKWDVTPYVNLFNETPENGFSQFFDSPRYSTGYTSLWNTLSMMIKTHKLKPYKKRVEGTYEFMHKMIEFTEEEGQKIKNLRKKTRTRHLKWKHYPLNWKIDTLKTSTINFKGFQVDTILSEVTNLNRLKYDHKRPFTKVINYQNYFIPTDSVEIPQAYIIKKGWSKVITLLDFNKIKYSTFMNDTVLRVESYTIGDYKTKKNAFEGHYLHYNTKVIRNAKNISFSQGDIVIPTNQIGIRYLIETLEPQATDSFFNWNFFDSILQQKESFSSYVFEDLALEILQNNTTLRNEFTLKKESDSLFATNGYAQLNWVYKHSKYYEPAYLHYPVYRILKTSSIDLDKITN